MPVTYDEARAWTYVLQRFTPSILADTLGVPPEAIEGYILGLLINGTIDDTGDTLDLHGTPEPIYEFVPLPPGPTEHPTTLPPERSQANGCYTEVLSPRGMPVRIRTERMTAQAMSTPGSRGRIKRREQRHKQMMAVVEERKRRRAEAGGTKTKRQRQEEARRKQRRDKRQEKKANKEYWE